MNRTMSYSILMVFLLFASSCKSESKKEMNTPENGIENEDKGLESGYQNETKDLESEESRKVIDKKETEVVKEVKSPPKEVKKKPKRHVDPGIEIEMGYDIEKEEKNDPAEKEEEQAQKKPDPELEEKPDKPEKIERFVGFPSHSVFDGLLKKHVSSSGVVDYKGLKKDESTLDKYLKILETNPPGNTWDRNQKLAFWINAYNAYTIKLILNNYPTKSITKLHGGKPWDVKWIKLDGKTLSLNQIENEIIRPQFNEPRIHFAVNCAAKSCPPLLNEAFKAKTLNAQLESQTKKFINNTNFNTLEKNKIEVSKIFEWYAEDFGDIAKYVMKYTDKNIDNGASVSYKEYDWDLNGK